MQRLTMKSVKRYSDIFMSFMLFMVEKRAQSFPMRFFAPLRLRVRKQFNQAWAVFPMSFSASSVSLVESEPVEDCGEPRPSKAHSLPRFRRRRRLAIRVHVRSFAVRCSPARHARASSCLPRRRARGPTKSAESAKSAANPPSGPPTVAGLQPPLTPIPRTAPSTAGAGGSTGVTASKVKGWDVRSPGWRGSSRRPPGREGAPLFPAM